MKHWCLYIHNADTTVRALFLCNKISFVYIWCHVFDFPLFTGAKTIIYLFRIASDPISQPNSL